MRALALVAVLALAGCGGGGPTTYEDVKDCLSKAGTVGVTRRSDDGRAFGVVIVFPGARGGSGSILFHRSHRAMENGLGMASSAGVARPDILDDTNDVYWSGGPTRASRDAVKACF